MSGALFVIIIPTEEEEKRLRDKPKKLRFDIPKPPSSNKMTINSNSKTSFSHKFLPDNKIFKSSSAEIQYGTFHQTKSPSHGSSNCLSSSKNLTIIDTVEENNSETTVLLENVEKIDDSKKNCSRSTNQNDTKSTDKLQNIFIHKNIEENKTVISANYSMEFVLKDVLKNLKIENSCWTKSLNEKFYQVTFSIPCDENYETLLKKLNEWGIGDRENSTVSIMHCTTFNTFTDDTENDDLNNEKMYAQKKTAWNRFMNSFTARLNVAQILRDTKQEAAITFDFITLLISAAILASFGLVGDSTIFLASSMLVSPLMGPIIATIFGTVIKDRSLQSLGIINEFLGIALATAVGYIFAIIMCAIDEKYETGEGFTSEILSRCELNSLLVGFLVAIPSGAAAAIAVLGSNTGSLVGVAISASILPPAVNSGIVWAFATISLIYQSDETRFNFPIKTKLYSDDQAFEILIRGAISMCITLSNVICIYVMGVLVLKIKEIAPVMSRNNGQFWKHDIKIARDLSKNCSNAMENDKIVNGFSTTLTKNDKEKLLFDSRILNSLNIGNASYQNTWSPMGNRHPYIDLYNTNQSNLQELERLYMTITRSSISDTEKYSRPNIAITLFDNSTSVYRSDQNELSFNRRASLPFDILKNSRQQYRNKTKMQSLEKIWETRSSENNKSQLNSCLGNRDNNVPRKFTITPAFDEIQQTQNDNK